MLAHSAPDGVVLCLSRADLEESIFGFSAGVARLLDASKCPMDNFQRVNT